MLGSVNLYASKALLEIYIHMASFLIILYHKTRLMRAKYLFPKDTHSVGRLMTKKYHLLLAKLFSNAQKRQTSMVIVFRIFTLKSARVNLIALLIWANM